MRSAGLSTQGYTADRAVVLADLVVDGASKGPHAFVMELRDSSGEAAAGVSMADMGRKTTGNDLDNARITFDNVAMPREALLNKYADITAASDARCSALRAPADCAPRAPRARPARAPRLEESPSPARPPLHSAAPTTLTHPRERERERE